MKPRIKPFIEYYWKDGAVYFFRMPGIAIKISDPSMFIYSVCNIMDGHLCINDIKEKVSAKYVDESQYIDKLLSIMDKELLLEDKSFSETSSLDPISNKRWSKNVEFFGAFCDLSMDKYAIQDKINKQKVLILGLGGVGSNVLLNLAGLGIKTFHLVDFDVVDISNLNRQIIYKSNDLGSLKADCAKNNLLSFLPQAIIDVSNIKISSYKDVSDLVNDYDIVVAAADLPRDEILDWINKVCVERKIPYICGGIDSRWATCFSILPGISGCIECWKLQQKGKKETYQEAMQYETFVSADLPNVAIMPMISMVASMISNEIIKILTNISNPSIGKLYAFDFITNRIGVKEEWSKDRNCPVCYKLAF